ncbi:hypothetical protein [Streptomyces sp. A5-4]|uniref:hypothetical protein n=1 Tax=Streptomyces sp. A5-4 TaxID=3384771 RepID=UPI003DA95D97
MQHLTSTGTALAVALLPLAFGVLLAKTMAGDPLAPVNALITSGGQRAPISPLQWRRCGRTVLSGWKAERQLADANAPGRPWRRMPPALEARARAYADRRWAADARGRLRIGRLPVELPRAEATEISREL